MRSVVTVLIAAVALCGACRSRQDSPASAPPPPSAAAAAPPAASSEKPRIVFLGDSLTAGLGLSADEAYPSLLQRRLDRNGLDYDVVNAGVSGDTSAGGLSRLDWALDGDVQVLVVALGGNDGLRGLPPEELQKNLAEIIRRAQARHITVVLAGMEAPPNYGRDYALAFHRIYPALAKEFHVALIPFLLQGVGGVERLNQRDGVHPTAEGARMVADNVWAVLGPIVERHGP
jgi:acyl-CoA thioesterase-1